MMMSCEDQIEKAIVSAERNLLAFLLNGERRASLRLA
jgi:hypothetical protein